MSLNVVNLVGRAGKDPEVRYFESGTVLCTLTIAVDRRSRNRDQPDWFNLKFWGKTAEIAANYVKKGSLIGVQGSLEIETWTDRNTGANRSSPVIRVSDLRLLGSRRDNDPSSMGGYSGGDDEF
ncbi:single-stranded DNA-binding protein [Crocosphaera sp.]|uniref:single-stranded DNA-binding protein n=1 Tax=Crocosphaera sp. TaxID=2729996 RepID=UPI003F276294|nr:single-stranded DNA-binding protein [Crocosphaera sp.]